MIVSIPLALGWYPVVEVGSALKSAMMLSVVAVPVAEVVTTVAQAPEPIALVPRADVPLAIVCVVPAGRSPATREHGAKLVAVLQVPIT